MKEKVKDIIRKLGDRLIALMIALEKWFLSENLEAGGQKKTHYIKCETKFFNDVVDGFKSFEIRKNDRDYQPGDDIVLKEYDKKLRELTGREERVNIIYMLEDYPGIEPGYCILGIESYY